MIVIYINYINLSLVLSVLLKQQSTEVLKVCKLRI
jgi:hypothetical protein